MLVVSKSIGQVIIHELSRSNVDQYFRGVSLLQVVVLKPCFDGKKGLLVELCGYG